MSSTTFVADTSSSGAAENQWTPTPAPNSPDVFPAKKELLDIAAVGLVCAATAANPVTDVGIVTCLVNSCGKSL